MNLINLMFAGTLPEWVTTAISIARPVLLGIITIACLIMIVTTLLQSSANQTGSSAISGGVSDSYFSHNKDNSKDGKLKRTTIVMASTIGIAVVLYFLTGFIIAL